MNPEKDFELPPAPKFPFDQEMIEEEIAKHFNVSITRAKDLFLAAYARANKDAIKPDSHYKFEIMPDAEEGEIMVIHKDTGYKMFLAKTSYMQVVPGTDAKIPVDDVKILDRKRMPNPSAKRHGHRKSGQVPPRIIE